MSETLSSGAHPLSTQQWFGNHVAAEDISLEVQGTSIDGKSLHIQTQPHQEMIKAGTAISILHCCNCYARLRIGDRQLAITREAIKEILVRE